MNIVAARLHSLRRLWQCFQNPLLVALLRMGIIRLRYFPYAIQSKGKAYLMLARPTNTDMGDLFILREVLLAETYREVLPLLPRRSLRVVDIGANIGSFTVWLGQQAEVGEAYCFEPEPDSFRLLQLNLANNRCGFAHALGHAVGGSSREGQITLNQDNAAATSIYDSDPSGAKGRASAIRIVAFSEWLKNTPGEFDLLKMDCEGAEWEIVRATSPTEFSRFAAIVAEVHDDPEKVNQVADFTGLMAAKGFRTIRWDCRPSGLYVGVRESLPAKA